MSGAGCSTTKEVIKPSPVPVPIVKEVPVKVQVPEECVNPPLPIAPPTYYESLVLLVSYKMFLNLCDDKLEAVRERVKAEADNR